MMIKRLLIANRGEIALRIARTAAVLGIETVVVHATDDCDGGHLRHGDRVVALPGSGVAAYLDQRAIIDCALHNDCDALHPGYGFLAENAEFGAFCTRNGLSFIGPTAAQLERFGDKLRARTYASDLNVAVLEASEAVTSAAQITAFREHLGENATIVIKATAGGGGRGMRVISADTDVAVACQEARNEAQAAFGDPGIYAERFLADARHIEVQILGDGRGGVTHLWERDCSIQRRYQKLIEFAPALNLAAPTRAQILQAAVRMAAACDYRSLGTFEFLLDPRTDTFYFLEANARVQVEHTVTEAILGLDLISLQLQIAAGASLPDLDLANDIPSPRGYAIQLRINAETLDDDGSPRPTGGQLQHFELASGPHVRVDTAAYAGYATNSRYDSLLAKLIVHNANDEFVATVRCAQRAAAECVIVGVPNNLSFLRAVLAEPAFLAGTASTQFVAQNLVSLKARAATYEHTATVSLPALPKAASPTITAPPGTVVVAAPLRGSVVSIDVELGESINAGNELATLEAMKMHHVIVAEVGGRVVRIAAEVGDTLDEGVPLLFLESEANCETVTAEHTRFDLAAPRADVDEVYARHAYGLDSNRPQAVAKRRKINCRTARENVADLLDPDSFIEYGALALAAQRRRRTVDDLMVATPADGMIAGIGTVNAAEFGDQKARCAVLAYDYTVLAGTQGHTNHKKKDRLFEIAAEWALPVVFFTEGGGGRPGDVDTDDLMMSWLDIPTFATWPQLSGVAPRIAVNSGRCFAGNAIIFGCADVTIATANSNIGLAGPAMIAGGGLGRFQPEDIGPIDVQTANGVVDIAVENEVEATAVARELLAYFQGPRAHWSCADQRLLRHLIPENRLRVYDVRAVINALADDDSVLELRPHYGVGLITALVRIEGEAFGLIANDPRHLGGAIDGEGGEKGARFLQLCDTFGLPIVSLCDTPGYMVGPDSEKTAAVRRGSRLILASANLTVPLLTVVLRKAYGLGAQAMAGGGLHRPLLTIAWPTGEFGPMGLEGAVELGFRKELENETDPQARASLYDSLLEGMYRKGKAVSVASGFEIDAVIDPLETRRWLLRGLRSAGPVTTGRKPYVDVW